MRSTSTPSVAPLPRRCRPGRLPLAVLCLAAFGATATGPAGAAPARAAAPAKAVKAKPGKGPAAPAPPESAAQADPAAPPPADSSPMADLKKSNAALAKLLAKYPPNWKPEAEVQKNEVRKIIGAFLDFGELAQRALGRHWDTTLPAKRTEFVDTLRELVERSYLGQLQGSANYEIHFRKEEKAGGEATVGGELNTTARGKKVVVDLVYKLIYKDGHWVVYDVITDEQSMLENYRAEFNKVINKESFDALLSRMKKKLTQKG